MGPQSSVPLEVVSLADSDLVLRLQHGDQDAFTELMARYQRVVYAVARRMLRDHGEAEDMVQHVFLEIYRYRDDFDRDRGSFKAWLFQYAYSRSIERRKYLSRRKFYHAAEITEVANRVVGSQSPSTAFEARQLVTIAVDELNQAQRRVILLREIEGHSLREIAEQTGEAYAMVRHHFYRGLRKMRGALAAEV